MDTRPGKGNGSNRLPNGKDGAQDRAQWRRVVCGLCSAMSDTAKEEGKKSTVYCEGQQCL